MIYRCYGLTLASDLALPELGAALDAVPDGAAADVVIEHGAVPGPAASARIVDEGMWLDGAAYGVAIPDVARFEARGGERIVIDRCAGATDRDVRLFLLGTMLGAIMTQRGHLVLHGNAVRVGDACAIVAGHSGAGKSSLAAEFVARGLDLLSDDVVPVDAAGRALPGYPRIKLWDDSLARLGRSPDGLEPVRAGFAKFNVPISRGEFGALPVRWIYALETADGPGYELQHLAGIAKFALLREHTYRPQWLADPALAWDHAQRCAALGAQARIARVRRPLTTMTPAATADALLADIGCSGRRHPTEAPQ